MIRPNSMEVLEARIAPALVIQNPIPDIIVGAGSTGKSIELSQMFDPLLDHPGHTVVTFTLNFDIDPNTDGLQAGKITIELFDNEAPLTVQNFLRYATDEANSAYIGTFLHRLFDFGTGSGTGMDIIQGGGFDVSNMDEHIDTFSQVHNEYSDSRQNTAGTIAMAKTGLGPNTGTSEWFININDNSSILGANNNSGFTVFGQVIEGMDVIQRLAQLPKANLGGVFTDLPVQNMNPDPDNDSSTLSPKPKPANLITITDVEIAPAEIGGDTGITYSVTVDSGENLFSEDPSIDGSLLKLIYNAANNGVATITVTATKAGEDPVSDTFTVTLRPNLIGTVSDDSMGSILLPGEGGVTKVKIQNNGGANFVGMANVKFYLSSIDGQGGEDQLGTIVNDDDLLVFQMDNKPLEINAAGELELTTPLFLGNGLIAGQTDDYRLIVKIEPVDGTPQQLFTDDDVAIDGSAHVLTNSFGTIDFASAGFGKRTDVTLKYSDPQTGKMVELSLKGPGTGQVALNEGDKESDTDNLAELLVTGTTAKSRLEIGQLPGDTLRESVTFASVEVTDFIGLIDFSIVDDVGNVSLSGGARTVIFGDFNDDLAGDRPDDLNDTRLTIGASASKEPVTIQLGRVRDFSIESIQPIKSINATEWLDTRDPDNTIGGINDSITAPSIGSVKISGNLEANIETTTTARLSNISVEGLINNATIRAHGDIGKVTAGGLADSSIIAADATSNLSFTGTIDGSTIQSGGNLGKIKATSLIDSDISTTASLSNLSISGTITGSTIEAGNINKIVTNELNDADISTGAGLSSLSVSGAITGSTIEAGNINKIVTNELNGTDISTTASLSSLSVSGAITGSTIQADGNINKIVANALNGADISASGGLSKVAINANIEDSTIEIGGNIGTIKATAVTASSISTDSDLSKLTVFNLIDDSTIEAEGSINKIAAAGLRDSTVSVSETLSNLSISGHLEGTTIEVDGTIKKLTAGALIDSEVFSGSVSKLSIAALVTDSTIKTTGDIGKVTVGGLIGSNIFAGTDARPAALSDFDTTQTIQSITIKGVDGVANAFVDSQVAAAIISKIVVRDVQTANGGETFGFVADKVSKYSRVGGPSFSKLDEAAAKDLVGDYELLILGPV